MLLDGGHHGREHLSVEMALATLKHLAGRYASDAAVKRRVDTTERSSATPTHDSYRGPQPWSAPEVAALKRFVDGRVVDGR